MMVTLNWNPGIQTWTFADDGKVPNSHLPVVVYKSALFLQIDDLEETKAVLSRRVEKNGWYLDWIERDAVHRYTHYHSTAHEVLLVLDEIADLQLGGSSGQTIRVKGGDAIAIPAGVAHRRVSSNSAFTVAGLYPQGQKWDLPRNVAADYMTAQENISNVPLPIADPFYDHDSDAPLVRHWRLR